MKSPSAFVCWRVGGISATCDGFVSDYLRKKRWKVIVEAVAHVPPAPPPLSRVPARTLRVRERDARLASAHPNMASSGLRSPPGPRLRSAADGSAPFYSVTAVGGPGMGVGWGGGRVVADGV